eukprot:261735_1
MFLWFVAWLCYFPLSIRSIQRPQCISSPPELELSQKMDSYGNIIHSGTLRFVAKRFTTQQHGYPTSFTTRVYNGILPGPTIRLQRGHMYHLQFYNDLHPNHVKDSGVLNSFHWPNTTNLHTHGLHVSPESPSDDVFLSIHPMHSYQYQYYIPCNHNGGTNYYHPHSHGSVALQIGGGAVGALIIEDDDGVMEGLPDWLLSMNELILVIQFMDFELLPTWTNLNFDSLTQVDSSERFYLINGQYLPSICLPLHQWTRLRILYSDVKFDTEIILADAGVCTIYLLAKDGVYTSTARLISTNTLYFTQSSRIDIAIQCTRVGTFELLADTVSIATILVHPTGHSAASINFDTFQPIRPKYLRSLMEYRMDEVDNIWNVVFHRDDLTINNELFGGPNRIQMNTGVNQINEWRLYNRQGHILKHSLHVHVNHFQLMSGSIMSGSDPNMTVVGDWIDTVGDWMNTGGETAIFRFWSDTFGTRVVLHCHMVNHEDLGMMGVYAIGKGCAALDVPCINANADGDCDAQTVMVRSVGLGTAGDIKGATGSGKRAHMELWMVCVGLVLFIIVFSFVLKWERVQHHKNGRIYMNSNDAKNCDNYGTMELDAFDR